MKIWSHPIAQNINEKFEKFSPKHLGQNFSIFFVHILDYATTSYFHFEMYWPLVWCVFLLFFLRNWRLQKGTSKIIWQGLQRAVTVIDWPNIADAKAPIAPLLNTPLSDLYDSEDFINFCGLLRKHELYKLTTIINAQWWKFKTPFLLSYQLP